MYPDVSGIPLFIHKLIHTYPGVCVCVYVHTNVVTHPSMTEGQTDSQIICSALCHTDAVVNLPTDVSADLTLA